MGAPGGVWRVRSGANKVASGAGKSQGGQAVMSGEWRAMSEDECSVLVAVRTAKIAKKIPCPYRVLELVLSHP